MLFVALILTLLASHTAHAGGTIGNPGSGNGSGGGANTRYGYGWYKFNTNGSGTGTPGGMKSGNWIQVQADCAAANATTITAFIVETAASSIGRSVVYTYDSNSYGIYHLYHGNDGGYWQSYDQAKAAFDALPGNGVDTSGYTFGQNVGYFCSDFQPKDWNVSPTVSVSSPNADPGSIITWNYTIKNNGPDAQSSDISYGYNTNGGPFGPVALSVGATSTTNSTYTIKQSDVGSTLCRATYAAPQSNKSNAVIASGAACVAIPYNYTLTPVISTNLGSSSTVGATVNVSPSIINSGPTKSQPTDWMVTQFIVSPGKAIPNSGGGISPNLPCTYFSANVVSCSAPYNADNANGVLFDDAAPSKVTNSTTPLAGTAYVLADLPVGSHVCFALSARPYSSAGGSNWSHSKPVCIVIAKSPKIQVHGGDIRVGSNYVDQAVGSGSNITTSQSIKNR